MLRIQARRAKENSPWRKPWETARHTKPRHGAKDCGGAIFRPLRGLWGTRPIPMAHAMGYSLSPYGLEKRPCVLATLGLPHIHSESAIPQLSCPTPVLPALSWRSVAPRYNRLLHFETHLGGLSPLARIA